MSGKKLTASQLPLVIQYTEKLLWPELWLRKADDLVAAAELLEPEVRKQWDCHRGQTMGETVEPRPDLQGVYLMLVAYAIEDLCKAELGRRERASRKKVKEKNKVITELPSVLPKNHDVTRLVRRIGLTADIREEDLLRRLSRYCKRAGHYPVPTGPDAIRAAEQFGNGKSYLVAYLGEHDIQGVHQLVARVENHVKQALEDENPPTQGAKP